MTNQERAQAIVEKLGGVDNICDAENCMTRLRVHVKDPHLVHAQELKDTSGVLGLVQEDDYIQVVLGPGAAKKIADLVQPMLKERPKTDEQVKSNAPHKQHKSRVKEFLELISSIFVPLIPAIIAAGLFKGFGSLINQLVADSVLSGAFWTGAGLFCTLVGAGFMSYFALFVGVNAAKSFGATPALGGMLGGISLVPEITSLATHLGLYNAVTPNASLLTADRGGIIGVIIGVWILALIEKQLHKRVPNSLDLVLTPVLTMLCAGLLFVFIIMPLAGFISDGLIWALSLLLNSQNLIVSILGGFILAAIFLPMVLLGLHHGLIPLYALQLESMGAISLYPVLAMSGAGQVGAAIALYVLARRAKNNRLKTVIAGALPAGFLGVGEPLIYGVTLPLGKPFITAGIGAGFGGAFVMCMHVMSTSWGPSGLVAIPIMQTPQAMLFYLIGLLISYVAGFVVTLVFTRPADVAEQNLPRS